MKVPSGWIDEQRSIRDVADTARVGRDATMVQSGPAVVRAAIVGRVVNQDTICQGARLDSSSITGPISDDRAVDEGGHLRPAAKTSAEVSREQTVLQQTVAGSSAPFEECKRVISEELTIT